MRCCCLFCSRITFLQRSLVFRPSSGLKSRSDGRDHGSLSWDSRASYCCTMFMLGWFGLLPGQRHTLPPRAV